MTLIAQENWQDFVYISAWRCSGLESSMNQDQAKAIFVLAGIEVLKMWELPNGYWGKIHNPPPTGPWWLVKTYAGLIEIGWRKRVISIDWSDTGISKTVTEDKVTIDLHSVHAWSVPKAVEYLSQLSTQIHLHSPAARKIPDEGVVTDE
jgi:hypothetical protein